MEYLKLVKIYKELESTTKKLEKTKIISDFIKHISKDELNHIIYLIQGRVFPRGQDKKIGMSSRLVIKVISKATGHISDKVEKEWKKTGDLGKVVESLMKDKQQRTFNKKELTTQKVYENIRKLPEIGGKGSIDKKISLMVELLNNANPEESKYIVRTILEEMRIGVASGIIRDAIAKSFDVDVKEVEKSGQLLADYGKIAELAKQGKKKLSDVTLTPGKPSKVMLAIKAESIKEIFKALGKPCQFEEKLDGFRCLIHNDGKEIYLFTRRLENVTKQFPDLIPIIKKQIKGKSYIIDTEFVGYEPETKRYLPFQNISQRIKRKYDIEKMAKKFPVTIKAFDILYYDGKSLEKEILKKRRKKLEKVIKEKKYDIEITKEIVTEDEKKVEKFFKSVLNEGKEGLIAKNLESTYRPGRYVGGWMKLKPTTETLDLVIIGAQWGEGKRSNWLSSFKIACKSGKEYLGIGKVGTGIKEKDAEVTFKNITKELKPHITKTKGKNVEIEPSLIVEVGYEEIQKSPTYESGYALRFPRVIRLRPDKSLNEVDDVKRIKSLYKKQKK